MFDYQQRPSTKFAEEYDKIQWNSSKTTDTENKEPEEGDKREDIENGN